MGGHAELHRVHYTHDQIFEVMVSAAVGAGLFRLDCVLNLLRSNHTAAFTEAGTALQELPWAPDGLNRAGSESFQTPMGD